MDEIEARVHDAFQAAPDLMGGLMNVYRLGLADAQPNELSSEDTGKRTE